MLAQIPVHPVGHVPMARIQIIPELNARLNANGDALIPGIRKSGCLQSLLVRETSRGWYELVAGHRRFDALTKLGASTAPVTVLSPDADIEIENFRENFERQNFTTYEEALRFKRWRDERDWTATHIAEIIGRSKSYVSVRLQLLDELHPDIIEKWSQSDSAAMFSDLRALLSHPMDMQLHEYNKTRSIRERVAARREAKGLPADEQAVAMRGRPRIHELRRRRTVLECSAVIGRHVPNSDLSETERKLVIGVIEYTLGLRSRLPFATKRLRGTKKEQRDFERDYPVGGPPEEAAAEEAALADAITADDVVDEDAGDEEPGDAGFEFDDVEGAKDRPPRRRLG
ncbi:MAG: ParB/RepB/Spo0J family partition protein [Polyangiales bacterium]